MFRAAAHDVTAADGVGGDYLGTETDEDGAHAADGHNGFQVEPRAVQRRQQAHREQRHVQQVAASSSTMRYGAARHLRTSSVGQQ